MQSQCGLGHSTDALWDGFYAFGAGQSVECLDKRTQDICMMYEITGKAKWHVQWAEQPPKLQSQHTTKPLQCVLKLGSYRRQGSRAFTITQCESCA